MRKDGESVEVDPTEIPIHLDELGISLCSRCGDPSNCKEIDGAQVCYDCATPAEVAEVNARIECDCPKCSAKRVIN